MNVAHTRDEVRQIITAARHQGNSIGCVPTMGALHEGHLALVRRAADSNGFSVVSIFVNPTQFNNPEDLEKYPRNLDGDMIMLEKTGCDLVFVPEVKEIYPGDPLMDFNFGHLDKVMEGRFRPGHFNGVANVVKRLFDIVQPDDAYFGEKDYQQLAIICELVRQLALPVRIVPCPIVRAESGLALSSRNLRLSEEERHIASNIFQSLLNAKELILRWPVEQVKNFITGQVNSHPPLKVEYFEVVSKQSLLPVDDREKLSGCIACIAAWCGEVRLIDNMVLI